MILLTGSEASTRAVFATLVEKARQGTISRTTLLASYARIVAMKAGALGTEHPFVSCGGC